jgi:nitrogen-specific signal transduction histidine kinase
MAIRNDDGIQTIDGEMLGELFTSLSRLCHQINNPLTSVMGRAQMLQMKVAPGGDEQLAKTAAVIEESAKRVAKLVQELANLVCQGKKEFVESYDSKTGSR